MKWVNKTRKSRANRTDHNCLMWQPISTAPYERDLELAVIDGDGAPTRSSSPAVGFRAAGYMPN